MAKVQARRDVPARRAELAAYAALVLCVALWGMIFIATAKLLPAIDAVQIISLRFVLVAAGCIPILLLAPAVRPQLTRRELALIGVCGVLAVPGSQYTIAEAQNYLAPPLAALIVTFSPAITAVFAAVFLRTRLGALETAGFVVALAGVALVLLTGSGTGSGSNHASAGGAAIALISPLTWAAYTMLVARLAGRHPPIGVVCLVLIAGGVALLPTYPHALAGLDALDAELWGWLVGLALLGTIVPNVLWLLGLRRLPVHRTNAFAYLIPVFATIWTALILGSGPGPAALGGGALVIAGVFLTQRERARAPA